MTAGIDPIPHEARGFQGRRAGLVTRSAAAGIDVMIVVVGLLGIYLGYVVVSFLIKPRAFQAPELPLWLILVLGYVVMTLYLSLAWHAGGRTYGCAVMGLRVLDRRNREIGLIKALLRAVINLAFPLGLGWVILSRKNLSVQDALLGTWVIYDWDARPLAGAT